MKRLLIALCALLATPALAQDIGQPNFPQILPAGTVVGRLPGSPGPTEAIPFSYISSAVQPFSYLTLDGSTSGQVVIQPQAVAGTPTLTIGTNLGTPVVTSSAPLTLTNATGNLSITGCAGCLSNGVAGLYTATPALGVAGTTKGTLSFSGNTSGTLLLTPQAAAGTATLTLPNTTGTLIDNVTAPLATNTTTGNISITGAAGTVLAGSSPAFTATPALGVAGTTKGTLSFSGNTSGTVLLTPQATAGSPTLTLPNTSGTLVSNASSQLAIDANTGTISIVAQPTLGAAAGTTGALNLSGTTSGTVTIKPQDAAGTYEFDLPSTVGSAGSLLTSQGGGGTAMTWSGLGQIKGTSTNDNATAGNIGETITGTTAAGSATSGTVRVATSVSLTAGDWDCNAVATYNTAVSTSVTKMAAALDTSTTTIPTPGSTTASVVTQQAAQVPSTGTNTMSIPTTRFSLASTTTINLLVQATFTVSTMTTGGAINCVRIR